MTLLTEQEIGEIAEASSVYTDKDMVLLGVVSTFARAIESAVIAKIKAQGPVAWAATSEEGIVEALGFNQSKSRFTVPIYKLPEGD